MQFILETEDTKKYDISGNEVIFFCIIKNDTAHRGYCERSLSELGRYAGITKQNASNVIKRLIEKGVISKEKYELNNMNFCRYRV